MADSHGHEASPFWAAIGKVSVVIGFLLGLFTLYHAVRPNEPKLTCDCQPAVFDARSIYASLRQSLETQRKNADAFQIEKMLRDAGVAATGQNRSTIPEVSRALADTAWPPSQASVLDQLTQRRAIVDCLLRNEGSRQATDAVLKLPFLIGGVTIDGTLAPQETYAG